MIEKIIFGDNQFFGVNHMSETKSMQQQEKFSRLENIIETISTAYNSGATGFMLHSHQRAEDICKYLKDHIEDFPDIVLYPTIPHPVKYMDLIGESGLLQAVTSILSKSGVSGISNMVIKGGLGYLSKDIAPLMKPLIDIELIPYKGLQIGAIFLQNMVTDLVLGMGMSRFLKVYYDYIIKKYNTEPAFQTANLPLLVRTLKQLGIVNPIIMAPVNKIGFFMNPSKEECEEIIRNEKFRLIPMSVLASGAISPKEAFEYACSFDNVDSVIFGASSSHNIKNSVKLLKEYL
jgi:hypothetical protein